MFCDKTREMEREKKESERERREWFLIKAIIEVFINQTISIWGSSVIQGTH